MGSLEPAANVTTQGMKAYAAPSLFQPHRAREAIRDAHKKKIPPMLCYYAGLSSIPITRFLAPMGFDAVWIDWEHTSCNTETMTTMVHEAMFMSGGKTIPWVRVPGHDHAAIGYALDAGASIVIPQVETVEQAKHCLSAAKFGTRQNGSRSAPPFRLIPYLTDGAYDQSRPLHECLNDQAAIMIQVESELGVRNLDAILTACPDIDVVWLGSLDARVSMNLPSNMGMGGTEPEWTEIVELFHTTLKKHDKPYGGFCFLDPPFGSHDKFRDALENMAFICCSADVLHLMGLSQDLQNARTLAAEGMATRAKAQENGVVVPEAAKENGHAKANGAAA